MLSQEGAVPETVMYLRRGQVVLSTPSAASRGGSCAVRGPDTILGMEGALGRPLPYEVRALTDVTLCLLPTESFRAWLGPLDVPLGAALRLSLDETLRRVGERQAIEGTAVRRVARFLLQVSAEDDPGEPLRAPLGVLASVLGMRPETLSRCLAELRASGALGPERGIRIADVERLRTFAD